MSIKSEIAAPFGRRLHDEEMVSRRHSVKFFKFALPIFLSFTFVLLQELTPVKRKAQLISGAGALLLDQVPGEGNSVSVPALVLTTPAIPSTRGRRPSKPTPIEVLNFVPSDVPAGAEGRAVLITGGTNGLVRARLTEAVRVDGVTYLDASTLLLGVGRSTEERLYVDFKKAVFRDGKGIPISAQAYDPTDSMLGLKGSRVADMTLKLAATSGLNFLSGMALGLETPSFEASGRPVRPSVGDAALSGVAQAAGEEARRNMEEVKNRQPVIEVPKGSVLNLTFGGER